MRDRDGCDVPSRRCWLTPPPPPLLLLLLVASPRHAHEAQVSALREEQERQLAAHEAAVKAKADQTVAALRQQLKDREKEVRQMRNMNAAMQAQYQQRVQQAEQAAQKAQEKARAAEARRANEAAGLLADLTLLRKRIANLERRMLQMRLVERLEDDERLDRLLGTLESQIQRDSGIRHQPRWARAIGPAAAVEPAVVRAGLAAPEGASVDTSSFAVGSPGRPLGLPQVMDHEEETGTLGAKENDTGECRRHRQAPPDAWTGALNIGPHSYMCSGGVFGGRAGPA